MTAIDADGFIWSIDINGEFRRAQGNQPPVITNPELFAYLENIHYKVNNQRPIEEVNYDLPPSNFTYRNNATDYPAPEKEEIVKNYSPNKSKKLTRLPNLDFLSKIKPRRLRTPFIVVTCLVAAIIAVGGASNSKEEVSGNTTTGNTEIVETPVEVKDPVTKEVKPALSKEFNNEKKVIQAAITSGKIERSKTIDFRLYYSLISLIEKGYKASFSDPECQKDSCSFVVKLTLKSKVYSYPMTIVKNKDIWLIKEIE